MIRFEGLAPHLGTRVRGNGSNVTVTLADQTTGQSSTKTLQVNNIDVTSAEWIAEAPSQCQGDSASPAAGNCTPVPLANFGSIKFTNATATANGSTGTISSSNWTAQAVQLGGGSSSAVGDPGVMYQSAGDGASASATPSSLSADGSSFSVAVQGAGSQATSSPSSYGDPGSGYGGGDPYGDGSGDPYGSGGGSYGDGGGVPYGYGDGSYGDGGGVPYGYGGGPLWRRWRRPVRLRRRRSRHRHLRLTAADIQHSVTLVEMPRVAECDDLLWSNPRGGNVSDGTVAPGEVTRQLADGTSMPALGLGVWPGARRP